MKTKICMTKKNIDKINNSIIRYSRFSTSPNELMEEFNSSIQFDQKLYIEDIDVQLFMQKCYLNKKLLLKKIKL